MVLVLNRLYNSTSLVGFILLLTISELCETLSNDFARRPFHHRNKHRRFDQINTFSDEGFVRMEVCRDYYVLRASRIFVEGSYDDWNLKSQTLSKMSVNSSSEKTAGSTGFDTVRNRPRDSEEELDLLTGIQALSIETLRLRNLSSFTFQWMSEKDVQCLNMRSTDIEIVAEDTLRPVQKTLRILDLANATIPLSDLTALMRGLHNYTEEGPSSILTVLSLANLGLVQVPYEALSPLQYSLQKLSLFGNDFRSIFGNEIELFARNIDEKDESNSTEIFSTDFLNNFLESSNTSSEPPWSTFPQMAYVTELDLRRCNISVVGRGAFRNLVNLRRLHMSKNNILFLKNLAFEGLRNLVWLDISYNAYEIKDSRFKDLIVGTHSFAELDSLQEMNFSYSSIYVNTIGFFENLPQSLTMLSFRGSRLSRLNDGIFRGLSNLQILDISHNSGFGADMTNATFEGLDMLQELYLTNTHFSNPEALEGLSSLRILEVKNNNINNISGWLNKFPLLEYFDASYNFITSWKYGRAFESNSKLEIVYLHSNVISFMSEYMVEDFKSLSTLTLANNTFVCNCQLKYFMEHLLAANNYSMENLPILVDYKANGTSHVCTDASLTKTRQFADTDEYCVDHSTVYWMTALQHGFYITILVIVCSLSIGRMIYRKWWYIKYVAVLLKNATVLSMINVQNCEDRIYMYDIFVSYANEDRNWVIEELIPNIEGPDGKFRICLHERDFQVGVGILDNIIMAMDQSRTIILTISECFLKSQWCQFEMHLAQHRLLETCREELVLVLLEEIPKKKRSKILHYLMMVKTYIVWPKDSNDITARKLFWKRLKRSITANKWKQSTVV